MQELKIDIGCGKNTREGYVGIDREDFGQEHVWDVRYGMPFYQDSVDKFYASHFLEHLTPPEIVALLDECHGMLKKGGELWVIVPHKDHERANVLWHQTYFTEWTFKDLASYGDWETTELVTNERLDIHWKALCV